MSISKEDIASQAFTRIGGGTITDFSSNTTESIVATQHYLRVVDNTLSLHNWSFATTIVEMNRLVATPADTDRWSAAYQIPTAPPVVSIETVLIGGRPIAYERYGDRIFCNATETDDVFVVYQYRPAENLWPPYFVTLVVLKLAAVFAGAVARSDVLTEQLTREAQEQEMRAKARDASTGQTARRFKASRMISARRGSGT